MGGRRRCWVFVLGDFGRSPRMQYHTASLLQKGLDVTVVALPGSAPLGSVSTHASYTFVPVPRTPWWIEALPGILYFCAKAVFQFCCLLYLMLLQLPHPDFVLVQIPPAIPTLLLCLCVKCIRRTKVLLDWHNFAFSLMALNPRSPRLLNAVAEWHEAWGGRFMDGHFCVSRAMKGRLQKWKMEAVVLYDRPHKRYKPAALTDTHRLMLHLRAELSTAMHPHDFCAQLCSSLLAQETLLTARAENGVLVRREDRPAVLVSSTSWTPDEDFSVLLSALERYDQRRLARDAGPLPPRLLVFITGKGHLREHYLKKMRWTELRSVAVRSLWLEADDYPVLLGSADLGISLHASSSGVDLPMKIVDMFGCHLPICSLYYPTISELVKPNVNGLLFSTPAELSDALWNLLQGFPNTCPLDKLKASFQAEGLLPGWTEEWDSTVWPLPLMR